MALPYAVNATTTNRGYELPHSDAPSARNDIERVGRALVAIDADVKARIDKDATQDTAIAAAQAAANNAQATASAAMPKAGGTFSAPVTLAANSIIAAEGAAEGGQIQVAKPISGTSLTANVAIDLNGNQFRIFELVSPYRGVVVDLTTCGNLAALATQAYCDAKVAALVGSAPGILDTLGELAAALQTEQSATNAINTALAARPQKAVAETITASWTFTQQAVFNNGFLCGGNMTFSGATTLYWQAYGGGWVMTDTNWVRSYGDKGIYTGGIVVAGQFQLSNGTVSIAPTTGQMTTGYNNMTMSADAVAKGSFVARATGAGDANLAGMAFHNDAYAMKMGVRADGYWGIGGWSRAAWSLYSDPSGNLVAAGNVTAYSDPRLKENFERVADPIGILKQLDGGTFNWKSGIEHTAGKAGKRDYGILADQVEAVMPEIVTDGIEIEGETYKTVAYEKLVPVLIEALKSAVARIEALEATIANQTRS
jgi:Chaperone of endosialidase